MHKFLLFLICTLVVSGLTYSSCSRIKVKPQSDFSSASEYDWPQFAGSPQRTNYIGRTTAPPFEHIWTHKASAAVTRCLLVADSLLYFTTMDGKIEALELSNGKRIGRRKAEKGSEATIAYINGQLIVASRYGRKTLSNYDITVGKYLWQVETGDIASEPLVTDDAVYISAQYRHIDKFDLKTGESIWQYETSDQHRSSPALAQGILVVGCDNGTIYALDAEQGELKWEFEHDEAFYATPVIWGDDIFIGSVDSVFYSLNLLDGGINWTYMVESPVYETAACNGERVLLTTTGGKLICLNVDDGEQLWTYSARSLASTSPVIAGDVVYFGSLDTHYYAVDLSTGTELWHFRTKGRIRTTPVIYGDYFFGASEDKFIYGFKRSDSLQVSLK